MAKRTTKGGLAAKVGVAGKKAVKQHRTDDTNFGGGGDLPPGIEGGIAQLTSCYFSQYKDGTDNAGEYFWRASGVVMEPTVHGNVRVQGLYTSMMEPMCDTPNRSRKTVAEHVAHVLNEFRKFGVDTSELELDDLEDTAAALAEEKPFFRFRTWQGEATEQFPDPRVNEQWKGACEYEGEGVAVEAVVDETEEGEEEALDGEAADAEDADAQAAITAAATAVGIDPNDYELWTEVVTAIEEAGAGEEEEEAEAEEEESGEESDEGETSLQDRGSMADEGDEEEKAKLTELAGESDMDPDDYETWAALADALVAARTAGTEEEGEEVSPEKGEVYFYKPKGKRKAVECEVTAVFKNKKCNLKNLDDETAYKAVPFTDLQVE